MSHVFSNELVVLLLNHFQLIQKASSRCTCIMPQIQMQWLEKVSRLANYLRVSFTDNSFLHSVFHWLNVLGSFGSENTGLSLCLCVCLSVCMSLCVCVRAGIAKPLGRFQWNLPKKVLYMSIGVRLCFSLLT